jgi:hypothetical protein
MALSFRPPDRFVLRLEGGERAELCGLALIFPSHVPEFNRDWATRGCPSVVGAHHGKFFEFLIRLHSRLSDYRERTSTVTGGGRGDDRPERGLFLSVFLGVSLSSFFRVVSCVSGVARGRMGVMCRLLVKASFVVLSCFTVVACCMGMMLRSLLVMLRRFFGHGVSLGCSGRPCF